MHKPADYESSDGQSRYKPIRKSHMSSKKRKELITWLWDYGYPPPVDPRDR